MIGSIICENMFPTNSLFFISSHVFNNKSIKQYYKWFLHFLSLPLFAKLFSWCDLQKCWGAVVVMCSELTYKFIIRLKD